MSSGLYSGVSGLALGIGLYKGVSGLWSGASGLIDGFGGIAAVPTLALDFLANTYSAAGTSYTFEQLMNFTRTTSATFVGSDGLVQTTPASRNVLLWTQEFDNAAWVKTNTTVVANSVAAPDGTTTADTLTATAANATTLQTFTAINAPYMYSVWLRRLTGTGNVQITVDGTTYATVAVTSTWTRFDTLLVGLIGSRTAGVRVVTSGDAVYVWGAQLEVVPDANLTLGSELISSGVTGLVGTATPATYNTTTGAGSVNRVDLSNQSFVQWSGLTGNFLANITHTSGVGVGIRSGAQTGDAYMTITGNATRTGYLPAAFNLITITSSSGAVTFTLNSFRQITGTVSMPSAYTRNVGGLFPPRFEYDPVTLAPLGVLIEEARTNLLLHSSDLTQAAWSRTNVAVSRTATGPDGLANTATTVTATTANATALQAVVSASAARATTCYIKRRTGTGTVEMTQNGGTTWTAVTVTAGWTRVSIPSATVTNPSVGLRIVTNGDAVDVALFQCETGAFPTSAIPTAAAQVTRTADLCSIVAPMFALWYNAAEGTFASSFEASPNTFTTYLAASNGVVAQNSMHMDNDGAGNMRAAYYSGSSAVALLSLGAVGTIGAVNKIASAYKVNDFAASRNGGTAVVDTSGAVPVGVTQLNIGADPSGAATNVSNTHIRNVVYYDTRLADAQLPVASV